MSAQPYPWDKTPDDDRSRAGRVEVYKTKGLAWVVTVSNAYGTRVMRDQFIVDQTQVAAEVNRGLMECLLGREIDGDNGQKFTHSWLVTFNPNRDPMFQDEHGAGWVPIATYEEALNEIDALAKAEGTNLRTRIDGILRVVKERLEGSSDE